MSWSSAARDVAYGVGLGLSAPVWGWSLWRTGKWRSDWGGRFGNAVNVDHRDDAPRVLVHGVSVGEVNLLRGLVDGLIARGCAVVVASTTNTGFARAVQVYGNLSGVLGVCRWPLDFSFAVSRFLDAVKPAVVVSAELEVWPNFVEACERRAIPFVVVNGRLSERSFRRYTKVKGLMRSSFARVSAAGVQTEAYAERFKALGVPADRVAVLDTMKWDTAPLGKSAENDKKAVALAESMGIDVARPVVVAGSTALGEARLLGEALRGWGDERSGVQLVVAPRKPEWFDASARELAGSGWEVVRRSEPTRKPGEGHPQALGGRVFLLDTIGELRAAYGLAEVCVVGRSLTGELYGSDPMEPAGLGKATVIGPWHADFAETVAAMRDAGGLIVTDDPRGADVGAVVGGLLEDRARRAAVAAAGLSVIVARRGSTSRHVDMVMRFVDTVRRSSTVNGRGLQD
ncbi:MAG: glycosyltransferase N-terminal domain-containing protein [Planctomycetota bacterium]